MNVVIKIDEYDISEDYSKPLLATPAEWQEDNELLSTSMRNFVNTYGIAI